MFATFPHLDKRCVQQQRYKDRWDIILVYNAARMWNLAAQYGVLFISELGVVTCTAPVPFYCLDQVSYAPFDHPGDAMVIFHI